MTIATKTLLATSVVLTLGACGGSSGSSGSTGSPEAPIPETVGSVGVSQGANPSGLTAVYDDSADTLTVFDGTTSYTFEVDELAATYVSGPIATYRREGSSGFELSSYGETSSGAGTVAIINSKESGIGSAFARVARVGAAEIPVSGSTEYTGSYGAILYTTSAPQFPEPVIGSDFISGNVTLTAAFGDTSTISGTVTDRVGVFFGEFADIDLELTSITSGGFSGTATGGEGTIGTASAGTYSGLLTGATADEAVGALTLTHTGGLEYLEVGVFVTEEESP